MEQGIERESEHAQTKESERKRECVRENPRECERKREGVRETGTKRERVLVSLLYRSKDLCHYTSDTPTRTRIASLALYYRSK